MKEKTQEERITDLIIQEQKIKAHNYNMFHALEQENPKFLEVQNHFLKYPYHRKVEQLTSFFKAFGRFTLIEEQAIEEVYNLFNEFMGIQEAVLPIYPSIIQICNSINKQLSYLIFKDWHKNQKVYK